MDTSRGLKIAKILRSTARIILIILASFWFVFALLSGAEELSGGLTGVLQNIPNALPWLLLYVFVFIAWKWEIIGGSIMVAVGIFTIFFFNAYQEPFIFILISLPLMLLGCALIASWYLTNKNKQTYE